MVFVTRTSSIFDYSVNKDGDILYKGKNIKYVNREKCDQVKYDRIVRMPKYDSYEEIINEMYLKFPDLTPREINLLCYNYKNHAILFNSLVQKNKYLNKKDDGHNP